jgi:hypothetical protein
MANTGVSLMKKMSIPLLWAHSIQKPQKYHLAAVAKWFFQRGKD